LAENQRDLLSKQLIMVQQAAALGSAIRSHQLNTLSQRYATYRLARNEYELIEKQLKDKSQEAKKFIDDYMTCMRDINNDKLIEYIGELQDDHGPEKLVSEYELVKEFLENSAQLQTYRLGDETRRELHNSASQQVAMVRGAFELLIQYGGIACHFTADYQLTRHRLTQLRNGLQHMLESQSGMGARDLVMQLTGGGHSQVQSIEHFALFACHLKSTLEALSYRLQENCEKLKCELEQPQQMQFKSPILMYESAKSTIEAFAANEDDAMAILEVVSLSFLTDLNQKYLDAEKYAAQTTEPDLMLNRKWFVDELHLQTISLTDLLDVLLKDNGIVSPIYAKGLYTLTATSEIYGHLSEIFRTVQSNVLPSVLKGIVCDDRSVLDMIAAVSNLQQNLLPLDELLTKMTDNLTAHAQGRDVSPHPTLLGMVSELKKKFLDMSETMQNEQPGSLGQQVFLQFQQMFEQLESDQNHLIMTVEDNSKVVSKSTWQRIDQIIEARTLSVSSKRLIATNLPKTRILISQEWPQQIHVQNISISIRRHLGLSLHFVL
jgi:serine/threonine-protein kinase SMG1